MVSVGWVGCMPLELRDRYADQVESYLPTPFAPLGAVYLDPEQAVGPPDARSVALGAGASVVLRFFRPAPNGPGPDLRLHELGPDGARARVAFSADGVEFVEVGDDAVGTVVFDLEAAGLEEATFVRVRGLDDAGPEPGYDLDAAEALH